MRFRKRPLIAVMIALTCSAAAAIAVVGYHTLAWVVPQQTVIATVDGVPITEQEFRWALDGQRATVIDYFHRTYGAEYDSQFWKTDFNGENPGAMVKKRALDETVVSKLELELAKRYGLIQGTSYDDLLGEMEKENKRRAAAVKAHQPVYGPVRLDESAFMNDYMSKLRNALKEKLSENERKPTGEALRRHYEQLKDTLFVKEETVRFQKAAVSYREARTGTSTDERKEAAKKLLSRMKQLVDQGKSMKEAVAQLQSGSESVAVRYSEEELNRDTAGSYFKTRPALYSALTGDMKAGDTSPVFDEAAQGEFVLIQVTVREATGYQSYEESERTVWNSYMDSAYKAYLNKLLDEARVEINQNHYGQIALQ
ncbi:hypothetical protein [Paenibacillus sp. HJGM_3]|uniref:hypothetical protein n=1 Tax=Paenibacillus sp. HJGM_3 TaxID=3379816 RepID=UPI00385E05C9